MSRDHPNQAGWATGLCPLPDAAPRGLLPLDSIPFMGRVRTDHPTVVVRLLLWNETIVIEHVLLI
jgi:hypothetical protein